MISTDLMEWLLWRLEEITRQRLDRDYAAMSHGGASFDSGYRAGQEGALRDVIDMIESSMYTQAKD
jgi:hypothetical protein